MKLERIKRGQTLLSFFLVISMLLSFASCGDIHNLSKHLHSSFTGLNRQITLYSADGHIIKEWITTAKVEDKGGTCYFLDSKGKAVIVAGTFIVQER